LNEPSGSLFNLVKSACKVTSLVVDILRECNTCVGDLRLDLVCGVGCRELGRARDEEELGEGMPLDLASPLKGLWLKAFTRTMMSMSNISCTYGGILGCLKIKEHVQNLYQAEE
jgi:hypothetical protein